MSRVGLVIYRQYVGVSPEDLEKNLFRILLASYYMVIEELHQDAHDLEERYETAEKAARSIQENARRLKVETDAIKKKLLGHLRDSFGFELAECIYRSLEKYLDASDLSGLMSVVREKSRRWHGLFSDFLDAEESLIDIKNERLQQICDVHVGELKIISAFKRLSNGKLDQQQDDVRRLLEEIKRI